MSKLDNELYYTAKLLEMREILNLNVGDTALVASLDDGVRSPWEMFELSRIDRLEFDITLAFAKQERRIYVTYPKDRNPRSFEPGRDVLNRMIFIGRKRG